MTPFLSVTSAEKSFDGLKAVDDVSFTLEEGALAALIGPNGAGKTTLFNLIAGALPLTSGSITFQGQRIRGGPVAACRLGIARTFQNVRLFHDMSVLENVMVGMGGVDFLAASLRLPAQVQAERLRMKRANHLLESVGWTTWRPCARGIFPSDSSACWKSLVRWHYSRNYCCSMNRRPG